MTIHATRYTSSKYRCLFKIILKDSTVMNILVFMISNQKDLIKKNFPKASSVLSALFLEADYFYALKVNLSSSYICSVHFELLSKSHKPYSLKKCVCCECFGKKSSKTAAYRNINPTKALVLHEKFGINNSYGGLICTSCHVNNLPEYVDHTYEEEHCKAFEWLNYLNSANPYYKSESDDEEEFQSSHQAFFENDEEKKLFEKKGKSF